MKLTEMVISLLVIAAVVTGMQYFAGGVFTNYNTTQSTAFLDTYKNQSSVISNAQTSYGELNSTAVPLSSWNVWTLPSIAWKSLKMLFSSFGQVVRLPYTLGNALAENNASLPANFGFYVQIASIILIVVGISYLVSLIFKRGGGYGGI